MHKNISTRVATLAAIVTILLITGLPTESRAYFPSNYVQESYVGSDEIPVKSVYDIVQTEDGYIWIASYEGLVRYDGTSSYIYTEEDGMPTQKINDLFIDSYGNLWIGTNDAGLFLYQDGVFTAIDTTDGLPHNMVRDIEEDSHGNIVIATQGGIAIVSQELEVSIYGDASMNKDYPIDLIVTENDDIFTITNGGNILSASESDISGTMEVVYSPTDTSPRATAVFTSTDGSIYFGFSDGKVIKYSDDTKTEYDASSMSAITSFYESDGVIYICGENGLGIIYNDEFIKIDGLELDGIVDTIFKDYEGNYWVGSSRDGIVKLVKNSYTNVSAALGLPELTVNSTAVFNDDLYIGSDDGLVIIDGNTKEVITNEITELLNGVRIRNLCVIDDEIWVSTYSSNLGLVVVDSKGSYELINTANSALPSDDIRFTIPLQDNQVFVGTKNGAAIFEDREVKSVYDMSNGLDNEFILSACQTSDGTIYVGTDGGGFYTIAPDGSLAKVENDSSLNTDIVLRLETDPTTDNVWLSTNGGLAYVDDNGVHPVKEVSDAKLTAFDIKFYGDEIWLICSDGIYSFDRIALQNGENITLDKLGEAHFSVTPNSWNGVYEDTLFLSTTSGVYAINMNDYYENEVVPKLSTPVVTADGVPIPIVNGVVTIPSDTDRMTINVSILSSLSDSGYQITVQLIGIDDQKMVFDSKSADVSYTNIPGGSYELIITAENHFGIEAEPIHIQVEKEYALSEYKVVRIFTILALVASVMIVTYLIQRKVNQVKIARQNEYRLVTHQAINAIADAIDAKDPYTRGHSNRVAEYAKEIGTSLGLSESEVNNLYIAGLLHDIGKIGVNEWILTKPGKLTDEEFLEIKKHCATGADILKSITVVDHIAIGAKYHHERFDGKGYPEGLKGTEIPLYGRIICVADSYDAMTSTRTYRIAMTPEEARAELLRNKGTQFDPEIVDVMVTYIDNKIINKQSN